MQKSGPAQGLSAIFMQEKTVAEKLSKPEEIAPKHCLL